MSMVADMILAVAVIPLTAGTVAEFQLGVGNISPPANSTFVEERFLGRGVTDLDSSIGGELDDRCFSWRFFPAEKLPDLQPKGQRDDVDDILSEEQKVICQSDQREEVDREGVREYIHKCEHQIEQGKDPGLHRNDEEQQERCVGIKCRIGQEQAHVQIGHIGPKIKRIGKDQAKDIHEDHAGKIEQIEPERAPLMLYDPAKGVVAEKSDSCQEDIVAGIAVGQRIGKQPPDLSMQDRILIKDQKLIDDRVLCHHRHHIGDGTADTDVQHQVRDTLIPVDKAEAVEASSKIFQMYSTPIGSSVYSISISVKSP